MIKATKKATKAAKTVQYRPCEFNLSKFGVLIVVWFPIVLQQTYWETLLPLNLKITRYDLNNAMKGLEERETQASIEFAWTVAVPMEMDPLVHNQLSAASSRSSDQ